MRLAIYARSLSSAPTGRGTFARHLAEALLRDHPDVEAEIFSAHDPGLPRGRHHPAGGAWQFLRGTGRRLRSLAPDAFWSATHVVPCGLPKDLPKVVSVLDLVWKDHPETMKWSNRLVAGWMEASILAADRIVCISDFTRARLVHYWPEVAAKASTLHLAPSAAGGAATGVSESPATRIVNVGTVEPRKNLGVLVDAMGQLDGFELVQCGGAGWNVDDLLRRLHASPRIRAMGYVEEGKLPSIYRSALCAVFPSIYEGFHLPPLDAANLGCPVVLSDIPVHREVMGDAALYFPPQDASALAAAVRRIAGDAALRSDLVARGRARAAEFSWSKSAAKLHALLKELAG